MSRLVKKFIAVLLAVWLPLFVGNALAESVVMQSKGGSCHTTAAPQNVQHAHHLSSALQHADHDGMTSSQNDPQNSSCNSHAICHLACCGYVAGSVFRVVAEQQTNRAITPYLVASYTLTLPLFDPPPLARA